jgi:two-component system, sensor histidine kinase and response regulator
MNYTDPASGSTANRVLIVDDVPDNVLLLQVVLKAEGYTVDTATSGKLALEKITANPPNIILLDVMMPGMDGYEVTRRIRQNPELPLMPILLITGCDRPNFPEGFHEVVNGFIRKPIKVDDVLNQVRATLIRHKIKQSKLAV